MFSFFLTAGLHIFGWSNFKIFILHEIIMRELQKEGSLTLPRCYTSPSLAGTIFMLLFRDWMQGGGGKGVDLLLIRLTAAA